MTVDAAIGAAFDRVASRERDAMRAFDPGATPEHDDVRTQRDRTFAASDPLSVALPERAYAIVVDERGRRLYTRDGTLGVREGCLEDASGYAVQGYVRDGSTLSDLRVDGIDAALGRPSELRIDDDGRVTYARNAYDPRTGVRMTERVTIGRIALARFPAGTQPNAADGEHVSAPPGVIPHAGVPGDGTFGVLRTMARDGGAVDIDTSLRRLKEAYLALDALRAARHAQGGVEKNAMDLLK